MRMWAMVALWTSIGVVPAMAGGVVDEPKTPSIASANLGAIEQHPWCELVNWGTRVSCFEFFRSESGDLQLKGVAFASARAGSARPFATWWLTKVVAYEPGTRTLTYDFDAVFGASDVSHGQGLVRFPASGLGEGWYTAGDAKTDFVLISLPELEACLNLQAGQNATRQRYAAVASAPIALLARCGQFSRN